MAKDMTEKLQQQVKNLTFQIYYRDQKLLTMENAIHEVMMTGIETRTSNQIQENSLNEQNQKVERLEKELAEVRNKLAAKESPLYEEIARLNRVVAAMDKELQASSVSPEEQKVA